MAKQKTYGEKRSFDKTPEPAASFEGDVDVATALAGKTFVVHQHHATRLHFDLRLEMFNGDTPVLVSWAVPKNLPWRKGKPHLAIHVEDHPFEYGSFSGTIPKGEYGGGEVRIFDAGEYELLEQEPGKLTFVLHGQRLRGEWHMVQTKKDEGKDEWLVFLRTDDRPDRDPPPPLTPMLATLERDPFDSDDHIFEPKWDGVRTLAVCTDETRLLSRTGRDCTATYAELNRLHERLVCIDAIVDGEIVAMEKGRPSFERLQSRINVQHEREIARLMKSLPVSFIAFDLLYLDGRSLLDEPIETRKQLLDELVVPSEKVQVSAWVEGAGMALADAARAQKLEGIVAKKLGSHYKPGRRSKDWLKIKVVHEVDVVVGGWTRGEGSRADSFGALLVGAYAEEGLRFLGAVGTGYPEKMIEKLLPMLRELETDECPFAFDPTGGGGRFGKPIRNPSWVRPELVARVEFRELTSADRLRAPSFKGLRTDAEPSGVLYEEVAIFRDG